MADPRALRAFGYWAHKYRRSWRRSLLPSLIGPALYMIVMGKVLGSLVADGRESRLGGVSYLAFVAPAVVAAAAMLTASSEATFHVFHATRTTRAYVAMLATPLRVIDLVTGHLLWMAVRMVMVGTATLAVLVVVLGASHSWGVVLLVPIGTLTGMAVASGLMGWSARQRRATNMLGWQRFGATPMLLFGGIFFPVRELPVVARRFAQLTPVWHGAELSRDAALGSVASFAAAGHALYLVAFVVGGTVFAYRSLESRLVEP